jgi:hypothetical protein
MRGGITLNEAYMLTLEERELVQEILIENKEMSEKSGVPFI